MTDGVRGRLALQRHLTAQRCRLGVIADYQKRRSNSMRPRMIPEDDMVMVSGVLMTRERLDAMCARLTAVAEQYAAKLTAEIPALEAELAALNKREAELQALV